MVRIATLPTKYSVVENVFGETEFLLYSELSKRVAAKCMDNSQIGKTTNIVVTGGRHGPKWLQNLVRELNTVVHACNAEFDIVFWLSDDRFVDNREDLRNDYILMPVLSNLDKCIKFNFETFFNFGLSTNRDSTVLFETNLSRFLKESFFDFVVLSLSDDGHLASIFNSYQADYPSNVVKSNSNNLETPFRITLTFSALKRTTNLSILAIDNSIKKSKHNFLLSSDSLVASLILKSQENLEQDIVVSCFELES
jgi:6-phosphogluconolactonase/glucosamine-6-phosphate isomerase/deaminase